MVRSDLHNLQFFPTQFPYRDEGRKTEGREQENEEEEKEYENEENGEKEVEIKSNQDDG